jgi:uncharacterized LabA/DUF88 family protein
MGNSRTKSNLNGVTSEQLPAMTSGRSETIAFNDPSSEITEDFTPPNTFASDRVAIFIDGGNLFYAAAHLGIEIDYIRLLERLTSGRRLLRAYYYTGVDPSNEKQQGFLLWMRRHGYRVVTKDLVHFPDGSRKANLLVEIAVDMLRLAEHCDTIVLLSGDGELAYALNNLSYRGVQVEVVSLRAMTSERLIDIADFYRDLTSLQAEIKRLTPMG